MLAVCCEQSWHCHSFAWKTVLKGWLLPFNKGRRAREPIAAPADDWILSIDPGTGGLAVLGLAADARGPRSSPTGPFSRAVFVAVRTSDRSRPCTAAVVAAIRRATSE